MKRMLTTVAAAALFSGAVYVQSANAQEAGRVDVLDAAFETAGSTGSDASLRIDPFENDLMRGADILDLVIENGEELNAHIADAYVTPDGAIAYFIVSEGGFFGEGGQQAVLAPPIVTLDYETGGALSANTSYDQDDLSRLVETVSARRFNARPAPFAEFDGWTLASIIDSPVSTETTERFGSIEDVLFSDENQAQFALIRANGRTMAVSWDDLVIEDAQGETHITVTLDDAALETRPSLEIATN